MDPAAKLILVVLLVALGVGVLAAMLGDKGVR